MGRAMAVRRHHLCPRQGGPRHNRDGRGGSGEDEAFGKRYRLKVQFVHDRFHTMMSTAIPRMRRATGQNEGVH